MADVLWLLAVAAGPVILGGAIVYATLRSRRLSPAEKQKQTDAVQDLYHKKK